MIDQTAAGLAPAHEAAPAAPPSPSPQESPKSKLEVILGVEGVERLDHARVLVFGCGGVGSNCIEALARGGVGTLAVVDREIVALLNKRAGHSLVIRGLKPGAHLGLYDARREEEIFARVDSYNEGPLYNENLREIYATILKIMKETPSV